MTNKINKQISRSTRSLDKKKNALVQSKSKYNMLLKEAKKKPAANKQNQRNSLIQANSANFSNSLVKHAQIHKDQYSKRNSENFSLSVKSNLRSTQLLCNEQLRELDVNTDYKSTTLNISPEELTITELHNPDIEETLLRNSSRGKFNEQMYFSGHHKTSVKSTLDDGETMAANCRSS